MIRVVEALRYRSLRYVRQDIAPFQVLVGPNASGKSTFLDVIRLLGDLLTKGLPAVRDRSSDLSSLVWMGQGQKFEIAIELDIPADRAKKLPRNNFARARYEVALGLDS